MISTARFDLPEYFLQYSNNLLDWMHMFYPEGLNGEYIKLQDGHQYRIEKVPNSMIVTVERKLEDNTTLVPRVEIYDNEKRGQIQEIVYRLNHKEGRISAGLDPLVVPNPLRPSRVRPDYKERLATRREKRLKDN